ncbi:MAG: Transposase, partial [Actinobacteria bacterium]|nr:Transposase [Actinomycetota bacterium]
YGTQSAQLKEIRAESPEDARWSFSSQQATLRQLNRAFVAFFKRCKEGAEEPGYPRFKASHRFDSVEWPKDGDGCRWKPQARRVYLQGIGDVKVSMHRPMQGVVKTITVKREGRRWYVIFSCDQVPAKPLPAANRPVGIDVGITTFIATSDGAFVENPRYGKVGADALADAKRVLARKKRGSNNRRAARETVANRSRRIANQRRDFHHKVARHLITYHDVICIEDLRIHNLTASASGTVEEPGTNVAQKAGLNKAILDAGWGQFRSILTGKAEEAGRRLIAVDPRYTSQTCLSCGHVQGGNRVGTVFRCLACGYTAHADTVGACNVLGAGLALLAAPEQSDVA